VAVNARDAGLTVQVATQNPHADARLLAVPISSFDAEPALVGLASAFGLVAPGPAESLAALYESERKLLAGARVIPLFHLPALFVAAPNIRVYEPPPVSRLGDWRFENVWLAGSAP
jgi:hypothetical protein